jgi:hypothetical protein
MEMSIKKIGAAAGTAAACVACCAGPALIGPLLAWIGVTGLGFVFSPWYLLLLAVPATMLVLQQMRKKTLQPDRANAGGCGCSTPSLPNERKNHGCQ